MSKSSIIKTRRTIAQVIQEEYPVAEGDCEAEFVQKAVIAQCTELAEQAVEAALADLETRLAAEREACRVFVVKHLFLLVSDAKWNEFEDEFRLHFPTDALEIAKQEAKIEEAEWWEKLTDGRTGEDLAVALHRITQLRAELNRRKGVKGGTK